MTRLPRLQFSSFWLLIEKFLCNKKMPSATFWEGNHGLGK